MAPGDLNHAESEDPALLVPAAAIARFREERPDEAINEWRTALSPAGRNTHLDAWGKLAVEALPVIASGLVNVLFADDIVARAVLT